MEVSMALNIETAEIERLSATTKQCNDKGKPNAEA